METSEVLNTAADLIEERGWAVGNCGMSAAPDAPMCLEGALAAALGTPTAVQTLRPTVANDIPLGATYYEYCDELRDSGAYVAIQRHVGTPYEVWEWNDDGGRTAAEVIEVLRAAAVIEAAKEQESAAVSA